MSKIDEMIQRLCPDGVEYRKLGEVGVFTRGSGIQKKDFVEDGKPCIHYGQIYTRYGMVASEAISSISAEQFTKAKKAEPGDVIISITSENIEDVCTPLVWEGDVPGSKPGTLSFWGRFPRPHMIYLNYRPEFRTGEEWLWRG